MLTGLMGLGRKRLGRRSRDTELFLSGAVLQSNPSSSPPPPLHRSSEGDPLPDEVVASMQVYEQ